jgi:hypothetical protein
MKKINGTYAKYYNSKYNRRGPVFADRFKSKIIDSLRYFLTAICYIHHNPIDLGYSNDSLDNYEFSSYRLYTSEKKDLSYPVNKDILVQILRNSRNSFLTLHQLYTKKTQENIEPQIINDDTFSDDELMLGTPNNNTNHEYLYVTGSYHLHKDISPRTVLTKISNHFDLSTEEAFSSKYTRIIHDLRSLTTVFLRSICGLTYREIASFWGNSSLSNIYWLNEKGISLLKSTYNREHLRKLIYD